MNFSSVIKLASMATERNLSSTRRATWDRSRSTRVDSTSSTDITVLPPAYNAPKQARAIIVETAVAVDFICSVRRCRPHSGFAGITHPRRHNGEIFACCFLAPSKLLPSFLLDQFMTFLSFKRKIYLTRMMGVASGWFTICMPSFDWLALTTREAALELYHVVCDNFPFVADWL